MISDIKNQLKVMQRESFSGHIKFGIEKGKITNIYVSTLKKDETIPAAKSPDYDEILRKIATDNYYGTVEYDFDFGKITNLTWSCVWSGQDLINKLRENKCKYVKIVVAK